MSRAEDKNSVKQTGGPSYDLKYKKNRAKSQIKFHLFLQKIKNANKTI